jgi:hypothetical protein
VKGSICFKAAWFKGDAATRKSRSPLRRRLRGRLQPLAVPECLESRRVLSATGGLTSTQSTSNASFDMSEAETLLLYLVNRTRRFPEQWGSRLSISLPSDQVGPFAPLVTNSSLLQASRLHSEEMLARTTLSHYGANGSSPGDRAVLAGYPTKYVGENVGFDWNYPSYTANAIAPRMNDGWFTSSGHRANMLTASWTQFGGAFAVRQPPNGTQYATELFGKHDVGPFLTGVVFSDTNADVDYDAGEGLGGVTVTATGTAGTFSATTQAAGGWTLKVPAGQYAVTASGGSFGGKGSVSVAVGTANVAVDFVSGRGNGWVNFEESGTPGTPGAVPQAPSGVVATASAGRATLSWSPPTASSGGAILNYIVQHSSNGGSTWLTFNSGAASTATTATVTGLTNGTRYIFRVAAVHAAGTGAFSAVSNAVTPTGSGSSPAPTPSSKSPVVIYASISGPSASVAEGAAAVFTITLSQPSTKPAQVGFRTVSGSATAGRDFTNATGFVTFAPGETTKTVSVSTIDDSLGEAAEWLTLQLVRRPGPAQIGTGSARATIAENDGGGLGRSTASIALAAAFSTPQATGSASKRQSTTKF